MRRHHRRLYRGERDEVNDDERKFIEVVNLYQMVVNDDPTHDEISEILGWDIKKVYRVADSVSNCSVRYA